MTNFTKHPKTVKTKNVIIKFNLNFTDKAFALQFIS